MAGKHRRRVGAVRPSHLMFTSGVGALVDLPNFSVLVRGLDDWNYDPCRTGSRSSSPGCSPPSQLLRTAPIKRAAAGALDGRHRRRPQQPGGPDRRAGDAVPGLAALHRLRRAGAARRRGLRLRERQGPHSPHEARFFHADCRGKKQAPAARGGGPLRARLHGRAPRRLPVTRIRPPGRALPRGAATRSCGWTTAAATSAPTSRSSA